MDVLQLFGMIKGQFPAKDEIGSLDYETFIRKLNEINVEVELVTFWMVMEMISQMSKE